jgi:hypothetical protein
MPSKVKYKWNQLVQMTRKYMQGISVRRERDKTINEGGTFGWNRILCTRTRQDFQKLCQSVTLCR